MLPWRRQASSQESRQVANGLETSASSPPFAEQLLPSGCLLDPNSSSQFGKGAGSLRHSYSCPPIRAGSSGSTKALLLASSSAAAAQQHNHHLPARRGVRMSDSHLQLATTGGADGANNTELELEPSWGALQTYPAAAAAAGAGNGPSTVYANGQHHDELERRKFTRNLLSANNKKESLERYKAIMSLIEACKRRLDVQLGPSTALVVADAAWGAEPLVSLMQAVLDVGEALASFGNCHFPEHSNEARAILAGDYRALLRQYLSTFGFVFAQPTAQQLSHDMQEEVQCVGSLLATRCDAYDLLYDQLVRHVGLEGRGGPSTLILNHNTASAAPNTSITANPTNTTSATAHSKSKALNSGIGAAAIAAAGLIGLLLLRGLRGAATRRSHRGSGGGGSGEQQQHQRPLRVPKGRNGRELLLVSQLTGCADELRKAKHNEELLIDDWRLGRHVRLAWPPGPPLPTGFSEGAPDACNVGQLLQEMYG